MADEGVELEAPEKTKEDDGKLEEGGMEPMKVGGDDTTKEWMNYLTGSESGTASLPGKYQLVSSESARNYSIYTVRYLVLASAVNTKILTPNYPLMVTPDAHDDSFSSTAPFGVNSATYFIPMCTLLGVAISSIFLGSWSDKVGRKRVLMILACVSTVGTVVKYFLRGTFWGYNAASFAFGFFLGNLPVAMAYAGDVFPKKEDKEAEMGVLVGCFVMGNSGGGMIAILMNTAGLFAPLWVGAFLMFIACLTGFKFLIEPGDSRMVETHSDIDLDDEDAAAKRPETINQPVMWNVILGALLDNIGSTGLFPLCLAPLALEQYLNNPDLGDEPIMSYTGYQWLSVCVALMVSIQQDVSKLVPPSCSTGVICNVCLPSWSPCYSTGHSFYACNASHFCQNWYRNDMRLWKCHDCHCYCASSHDWKRPGYTRIFHCLYLRHVWRIPLYCL